MFDPIWNMFPFWLLKNTIRLKSEISRHQESFEIQVVWTSSAINWNIWNVQHDFSHAFVFWKVSWVSCYSLRLESEPGSGHIVSIGIRGICSYQTVAGKLENVRKTHLFFWGGGGRGEGTCLFLFPFVYHKLETGQLESWLSGQGVKTFHGNRSETYPTQKGSWENHRLKSAFLGNEDFC